MRFAIAAFCASCVFVPSLAQAGDYAPMNCSKAASAAEITICTSYALGQDEARMATLYGIATSLVAMGQRGAIHDDQHKWMEERDACGGNISCLSKAYEKRIGELNGVIDAVAAHGPF
jgi:uncharacterized protein